MSDAEIEHIVAALRVKRGELRPAALVRLLEDLLPVELNAATFLFQFRRAFPDVPISVLTSASRWDKVSGGSLSEEEFNAALGKWFPVPHR